jgi:hypothetical protein
MTREEDRKRGNDELPNDYDQKVENRFDKEARAKANPDGSINGRRMGKSHADDGGKHRH